MTKISNLEKKIGMLSAAAVSAMFLLSGCQGYVMENRKGIPSAKRQLGYQKDTALPGASNVAYDNSKADADLELLKEEEAILNNHAAESLKSADNSTAAAESFPRMEDMSKNPVGPKKETAAKKVEVSGEYYIVANGDSLGGIAKKFKVKRADLIAANNITNPNVIRVGQKLKLPKNAQVSARGKVENKTADQNLLTDGMYIVKPNDSVSKIAKKLKVTRAALMEANNLTENSILRIGQKLVVPGAAAVVADIPKVKEAETTDNNNGVTDSDFTEITNQLSDNQVVVENKVPAEANNAEGVIIENAAEVKDAAVEDAAAATENKEFVVVSEDISIDDLCKQHNLDKQSIMTINHGNIEADGTIKAGKIILFK